MNNRDKVFWNLPVPIPEGPLELGQNSLTKDSFWNLFTLDGNRQFFAYTLMDRSGGFPVGDNNDGFPHIVVVPFRSVLLKVKSNVDKIVPGEFNYGPKRLSRVGLIRWLKHVRQNDIHWCEFLLQDNELVKIDQVLEWLEE